jgi:hypothetical protein
MNFELSGSVGHIHQWGLLVTLRMGCRALAVFAAALALGLFCCSAHAATKGSIKIDGVRELLPEDIKKIEDAVETDTLDLKNQVPDDYTNWATVLSKVSM